MGVAHYVNQLGIYVGGAQVVLEYFYATIICLS